MTPKKVRRVLQKYRELIPKETYPLLQPKRLNDELYDSYACAIDPVNVVQHLMWMCEEVLGVHLKDFECGCGQNHGPTKQGVEKAMRWLGFIQGCMWMMRVRTLNELKDYSRPDPVENPPPAEFVRSAQRTMEKLTGMLSRPLDERMRIWARAEESANPMNGMTPIIHGWADEVQRMREKSNAKEETSTKG